MGPPPRDVTDLRQVVRHNGSYLRGLDPGFLDGRFATPQPVLDGPSPIVGGDGGEGNGASEDEVLFWQDEHTVVHPGTQTMFLTYEPLDESEHLYWNGLYQRGSEWSREDQTVTIPDTTGLIQAGDVITVEYAYQTGIDDAPDDGFDPTLVGVDIVDPWDNLGDGHWEGTATVEDVEEGDFVFLMIAGTTFGGTNPPDPLPQPIEAYWLGVYEDVTNIGDEGTEWLRGRTYVGIVPTGHSGDLNVAVRVTGASSHHAIMAVFRGPSEVYPQTSMFGDTLLPSPNVVPVFTDVQMIVQTVFRQSYIVPGIGLEPDGYDVAFNNSSGDIGLALRYWADDEVGSSPSGEFGPLQGGSHDPGELQWAWTMQFSKLI